ncbi:MAG TPA: efflux RND transporter periplasmic adaptor subunit [Kofleriaceae bacterium]|nr:efflux RND transporter periplasmic adaptor subunit [Kofleriaceae bacterium]
MRWIFAVVVVGLVAMVALRSLQPRPAPAVAVHTTAAVKASITRTVSGAGKLEPQRKVNVSSNITGTLVELKVGIGSVVAQGDVIAQIDTSRYKAQVEQQAAQVQSVQADVARARANASYLAAEEKRAEELVASGLISKAELDRARSARALADAERTSAESRSRMARAVLSEAQNALGWATLTAPAAGTVLAVNHRVGERVRGSDFAEDVILTLGSLGEIDVRLEIGEHDVIHVKPGQTASVEIDAFGDRVFAGKVIDSGRDAIVKNAGTENEVTSFPVWVALDESPPTALSGMSAQVTISTDTKKDVVTVPIQAVTVRAAGDDAAAGAKDAPPVGKRKLDKVVFVVVDDVVVKRAVEIGLTSETHVEVVRGLEAGEVVVDGPYRTLARELEDGMTVAAGQEAQ